MSKYHKYVFDEANRKFLGRFDDLYAAESKEGFDSWHQDDTRHLSNRVAYAILDDYVFSSIVDLGCGKGSWIHPLKKSNNRVTGVDVSAQALAIAQERYPDLEFVQADITSRPLHEVIPGRVELITSMEAMSYLANWRELISDIARQANYALIGLYLPPDPIGFVGSEDELRAAFTASFDVLEDVVLRKRRHILMFGRSRAASDTSLQTPSRGTD